MYYSRHWHHVQFTLNGLCSLSLHSSIIYQFYFRASRPETHRTYSKVNDTESVIKRRNSESSPSNMRYILPVGRCSRGYLMMASRAAIGMHKFEEIARFSVLQVGRSGTFARVLPNCMEVFCSTLDEEHSLRRCPRRTSGRWTYD